MPVLLPTHVAIIMDGNGRWAEQRGLHRVEGHRRGVDVSENIIDHAQALGIQYLTLYAFSKENWDRPAEEVSALMSLLKVFLEEKEKKMLQKGIRLNTIGDSQKLPTEVRETLFNTIQKTSVGSGMTLTLALSYGSRDEIARAVASFMASPAASKPIDENFLRPFLDTKNMPDPDLIIRTSGEKRISNFLLWQGAYSEYYFESCLWPDFSPEHFDKAIQSYQDRERRFGQTSGQLKSKKGSS